jgi:hypothetical protein
MRSEDRVKALFDKGMKETAVDIDVRNLAVTPRLSSHIARGRLQPENFRSCHHGHAVIQRLGGISPWILGMLAEDVSPRLHIVARHDVGMQSGLGTAPDIELIRAQSVTSNSAPPIGALSLANSIRSGRTILQHCARLMAIDCRYRFFATRNRNDHHARAFGLVLGKPDTVSQ